MKTRRVQRAPMADSNAPADVRIPIKEKTAERLVDLSNVMLAAHQRYNDAIKTILDENDIEEGLAVAVTDHAPWALIVRLPAKNAPPADLRTSASEGPSR